MILVDANVLLYAVNESVDKHEQARSWLDGALNGREPVGLSWIVLLAFLRLSTRVGLFPSPLTVREAVDRVEAWLAQPPSVVLEPTSRHLSVLAGLLASTGSGGNLVNDAHLAALAVEHDATIVTYDTDFGRFPGVRWQLPG
ncbi:MAG: type II toxin-antitoxin system VapC family toxin [Thermoanaerobacterales bacterium]|nr:type II toxin-antitoxin system VapC family toxin [Thermoanaerobacterales bacterium]